MSSIVGPLSKAGFTPFSAWVDPDPNPSAAVTNHVDFISVSVCLTP